jgi:hypothetical protein
MAMKPMVAVSAWGGANDGARFLVAYRSIIEPGRPARTVVHGACDRFLHGGRRRD